MIARSLGLILLAIAPLVVTACGTVESQASGETRSLERYGIRVTVPNGWHARLTRGTVEAATVPLGPDVQHVSLGPEDVVVRLFESVSTVPELAAEEEHTHPEGAPRAFTMSEFGSPELGGGNPGDHGFTRRNFGLAERYFDLFVEAGAGKPSATAVADLNELVGSLDVRSGDFYPGTTEAPHFRPTEGWDVGSNGGGEVRVVDVAAAWASTVPYRDEPRALPPHATLDALPADGVIIWVGISRENRFPPTTPDPPRRRLRLPLQLDDATGGTSFEGVGPGVSLYRLHGGAGAQYDVDLWVFFGREQPTSEQRERAQARLDGLALPDWGSWELDGRGVVATG